MTLAVARAALCELLNDLCAQIKPSHPIDDHIVPCYPIHPYDGAAWRPAVRPTWHGSELDRSVAARTFRRNGDAVIGWPAHQQDRPQGARFGAEAVSRLLSEQRRLPGHLRVPFAEARGDRGLRRGVHGTNG